MNPQQLAKDYLGQGTIMQLATASDGQPWVCSVYYVVDDDMNIYWLSFPARRHSREIAANNKVAVTVAIKHDRPVVGIQAEGTAALVTDHTHIQEVMERYIAKYQEGKKFHANFVAGTNQHIMYKFTPSNFVLFDELTLPGDGRKEWSVT